MTYSKKGNFYIVTRHDSLLAVVLVRGVQVASPVFKTLPPVYNFGNKLDPAKVLAAVQEGIAEANVTYGTDFQASEIHHVEDDARPETLYKQMVINLIKRIVTNGEFTESQYKHAP
jgi:hypothetical protein